MLLTIGRRLFPSANPQQLSQMVRSSVRLASRSLGSRHTARALSITTALRISTSTTLRAPAPTRQLLPQQHRLAVLHAARRSLAYNTRDLDRLYDEAEEEPHNAEKQATFLGALVEVEPDDVIQRVESKLYTLDEECVKHYLAALVKTGRIKNRDLTTLISDLEGVAPGITRKSQTFNLMASPNASYSSARDSRGERSHAFADASGGFSSSGGGSGGEKRGSYESPVFVQMAEPSFMSQVWRFIRTVVIILLIVSATSQILEDRNMGGFSQHEVKPETVTNPVKFDDVQGADEAKQELVNVVEFLKNPQKFTRLGGRLPKGVLLMGPPGTGKTMLARAVAGEAGVPFFYSSGSEFDEMYVGVGARRVRELFAAAKEHAPCIVFMDELDAVGGKRNAKDQQYLRMTLNQLLVELDGFEQGDAVVVIGASNFPDALDQALVRPGRFDTHVKVPLPDVRGRQAILKAHARKVKLADEEDLWTVARGTVGFSGADLANIINQAALEASRRQEESISLEMLEWAKDKILMGAERKTAVIHDKDKKVTAYHEAGHALCALYTDGAVPLYKATIVPRGNALGMVTQLPEDDTNSITKQEMLARLVVCMGGRAAEEKVFGAKDVTSGASSDVSQATQIARAMVMKYAMSDKVGPMMFEDEENLSDETRRLIESEIMALLKFAMDEAKRILAKHEREHKRLATALLEYETLTAEEIKAVCKGRTIPSLANKQAKAASS